MVGIELTENSQVFFDSFNSFMLSGDRRVFNKLMARAMLYNEVKDLPGDIVECGVFKGTGIYAFLKLKQLFNPNSSKKVVGFDFFNTMALLESLNGGERAVMASLFNKRNFEHDDAYLRYFEQKLLDDGFAPHEFELIKGDIVDTTRQYVSDNIGFRISLLYMDVDLDLPTYGALTHLWERVVPGGLVVFDEYGYNKWSESEGVDRFVRERGLKLHCLDYICPTAYIRK